MNSLREAPPPRPHFTNYRATCSQGVNAKVAGLWPSSEICDTCDYRLWPETRGRARLTDIRPLAGSVPATATERGRRDRP